MNVFINNENWVLVLVCQHHSYWHVAVAAHNQCCSLVPVTHMSVIKASNMKIKM